MASPFTRGARRAGQLWELPDRSSGQGMPLAAVTYTNTAAGSARPAMVFALAF
jgi:hypothetical protein